MRRRLGAELVLFHNRDLGRPHGKAVPAHRMYKLGPSFRRRRRRRDDFGREERPRVAEEGVLGVVEEGPAREEVGTRVSRQDAAPNMPTSSFSMRDSPQDGTSKTRSSKMACGGNRAIRFARSALSRSGEATHLRRRLHAARPRPGPRGGPRSAAGAGRRRSPATRTTRPRQKAGRAARRA